MSMSICTSHIDWLVYEKNKNCYPKVLLEKYHFIEDIEIYCSNHNERYHDEERINLLWEILEK